MFVSFPLLNRIYTLNISYKAPVRPVYMIYIEFYFPILTLELNLLIKLIVSAVT